VWSALAYWLVDSRPVLLIDARTREGMSGSPVVIRTRELRTKSPPGLHLMASWSAEKFLGIYAGRIAADLDIGYVWRVERYPYGPSTACTFAAFAAITDCSFLSVGSGSA
jgi:hypothetical protein